MKPNINVNCGLLRGYTHVQRLVNISSIPMTSCHTDPVPFSSVKMTLVTCQIPS